MRKKLSVFGLGKLGVPVVACLISKGFEVIGVDLDAQKVDMLQKLISPVQEPRVQEMLNSFGKSLTVTQDGVEAVMNSDITFVIVATPSEVSGSFSNQYVLDACKLIGKALHKKKSYHLVSITSTVMPGSMNNVIQPCLEKTSGLCTIQDFGLCYNPEFIALGSVVRDFLNPDFILIGESDIKAGEILSKIYPQVCDNNPPVARMNFINAELTKLALNTFVTTKISFANMLARICEKLPNADVDVVSSALGLDSRIGKKYLKGAISYGGPCFPRDNRALTVLAESVSVKAEIAKITDSFNRSQITWLADFALSYLNNKGTIGILGLTYKTNTNVVEEAPGALLLKELISRNVPVVAYDPLGNENTKALVGTTVSLTETAEECIKASDLVIVATPWREFSEIPGTIWVRKKFPRTVIDCWRMLKHLANDEDVRYLPLGMGCI